MAIEDLWYKQAVIYCLDVEKYMDANGDGIGDFEGLSRRLDYLAGLGVTCLWLQPFHPSPNRDNGYDVTDYYGVHERHGNLGDFVEFMNHARALGLRVIVDLVVNHTSIDHPWFQQARADPHSKYRSYYVWSKERPEDHAKGIVFPGVQKTTWSWDERAEAYYFHRFYEHQADLNTQNPHVRDEIKKIMGFWLELGVSGFRMDAVPFLIEHKGTGEPKQDFELLHELRDFLQWRARDAILLAEANVPPEESSLYFGEQGDRLQMMLNFPVNQRLFYGLATGELGPLKEALVATRRDRPANAQWVNFLRSHDELDLGRLSTEQRAEVFRAFAPEQTMQLYGRGIRRRLAPMLHDDRRRLELAFSLLLSLPGTPMLQYGDEIGIGEDLALPERECARTPMQWSSAAHGGFTAGREPVRPVISGGRFGYTERNVADQRRERDSLLNWTAGMLRLRRECRELSWGEFDVLELDAPDVLALRYCFRGAQLLTLHNFSSESRAVTVRIAGSDAGTLSDLFGPGSLRAEAGKYAVQLSGYGYGWYRVGAVDPALTLSELVH